MSLSELVRNMRKRALLSQEEFAKLLNVSVGTKNKAEYYGYEENKDLLRKQGFPF